MAPVTAPQDNVTQLTERKLWLPPGGWVDTVTGTEILSPEHGAETPFLRHFVLKMITCQDRLGTNVGKAALKQRDICFRRC